MVGIERGPAMVVAWSSGERLTFAEGTAAMTDQRIALLTRLEQATTTPRSGGPRARARSE